MLAEFFFAVHVAGLVVAGLAEIVGWLGFGRGSNEPRELPWAVEVRE